MTGLKDIGLLVIKVTVHTVKKQEEKRKDGGVTWMFMVGI